MSGERRRCLVLAAALPLLLVAALCSKADAANSEDARQRALPRRHAAGGGAAAAAAAAAAGLQQAQELAHSSGSGSGRAVWRRRLRRRSSREEEDPKCKGGLWEVAKQAEDLRVLVAVQQLTSLNFFTPFGKLSKQDFTLLAPTDRAWTAFWAGLAPAERQQLRDGFAALLLYHQVLSRGYSARQMADKYSVLSALGAAINKDSLVIDMDQYGTGYIASGRAPQNYATVVREHEVCGAHLIVVDTVLLPFPRLSSLPQLEMDHDINATQWEQIKDILWQSMPKPPPAAAVGAGAGAGAGGAAGGGAAAGAAAGGGGVNSGGSGGGAPAGGPPLPPASVGQGVLDLPLAIQEAEEGEAPPLAAGSGGGGGAGGDAARAAAPPPPLPPGVLPDCASLAASGQLITLNGTLAGCEDAVAGSLVSIDGIQTVVSDAGQVNRSALPPPAPASGARLRWGGGGGGAGGAGAGSMSPAALCSALLAAVLLLAC